MPSPFPGMDPFLEAAGRWEDFHNKLAAAIDYQLSDELPDRYECRTEVRVYLHEIPFDGRRLTVVADDAVTLPDGPAPGPAMGATAAATLAEPTVRSVLLPHVFETREARLEIRDFDGDEVVAVIELLSRSNKVNHREQYLAKRDALLHSPVHLIELDLLRAGRPHDLGETVDGPVVPSTAYRYLVSRAVGRPGEDRRSADIWEVGQRDPLPPVPIPLRGEDFVLLDVRAALDSVYDQSRYARTIYRRPPDPPLPPADAPWAAGVLAGAGIPLPPGFPPADSAAPDEPAAGQE